MCACEWYLLHRDTHGAAKEKGYKLAWLGLINRRGSWQKVEESLGYLSLGVDLLTRPIENNTCNSVTEEPEETREVAAAASATASGPLWPGDDRNCRGDVGKMVGKRQNFHKQSRKNERFSRDASLSTKKSF